MKTNSCRTLLFLFLLLAVALPAKTAKGDDTFFAVQPLAVAGNQIDYVIEDLNLDGMQDLLFFHAQERGLQTSRLFSIFYQTQNGFPAKADQNFEADSDAVVYCVADVAPSPGKEIVIVRPDGLYYYASDGGKIDTTPRSLIETRSIFQLPDTSFMEHYELAVDLDDDGSDEIVVPQFEGFAVYRRDKSGNYMQEALLRARMQARILAGREIDRYLVSSYTIPNVLFVDYNSDGRKDIVVIEEAEIIVFFQTTARTFSDEEKTVVGLQDKLTQAYALQIRNHNIHQRDRFGDRVGVRAMEDLNNDGRMDLIIERFSVEESLFNPQKTTKIFFGQPNGSDPAKGPVFGDTPDNQIVATGFPGRDIPIDLDGDKTKELVTPSVELGFFKFLRIILSGRADITVYVYKCGVGGTYGEDPDQKLNITVDIDRKGRKIPVSSFDGDFNGDGIADYMGAKGDDIVLVFYEGDGRLKKDIDVEFPVQIPENGMKVVPCHLNGDARSDLVVVYNEKADKRSPEDGNVCLLINQEGGSAKN